jgi:hypothetical protein
LPQLLLGVGDLAATDEYQRLLAHRPRPLMMR